MLEIGEKQKYVVGQEIKVKRTDGSWSDAKVTGVYHSGIDVEFLVGNTFRGQEHGGDPNRKAFKFITTQLYNTNIK